LNYHLSINNYHLSIKNYSFTFFDAKAIPEAASSKLNPPSKGTTGLPSPLGPLPGEPGPPIPGSSAGLCALIVVLVKHIPITRAIPSSFTLFIIVCIILMINVK